MTLVDDRGRIGGRVNLVDAFAAMVILVLIPVAYGAYLLFRTPVPKLERVSPTRLFQGHNLRVEIEGTNLRPFMSVAFNTTVGKSFLIGSTKYALIDVPDLKPGAYDVVLFDHFHEVDRLPKALVVAPLVTDVELEVIGSFKSPSDALVARLRKGDRFPPDENAVAEVVDVGTAVPGDLRVRVGDETIRVPLSQRELPATLRLKCYTAPQPDGTVRCLMPGPNEPTVVAPDALLTLPSPEGPVGFQIAAVHAPSPPRQVIASPASR